MNTTPSKKGRARKASRSRGSRLKARRLALGLTQKELSAKTGVNVKLISAYENDHVQPRGPNWRLLLGALDGQWPEAHLAHPSLDPDDPPEILAHPGAIVDEWSGLCREVARLVGSHEARILVGWREQNGDLAAIAEVPGDKQLLTTIIRTCGRPTTLDDLRSVRALVDALEGQLAPEA